MTVASHGLEAQITRILGAHLEDGGPGLVVGVARRGESVFRGAFGLAHVELGVPLDPHSCLPIASITKQMTAMCALLVAEDGLLDIDRQLGRYLPGLGDATARPTLRQLMTHQSGLRCHLDPQVLDGLSPRPDGFAMATIQSFRSVNAPPGALQVYGNSGFHLIARAIEQVTGQSFAEAMSSRLFSRLGMNASRVLPSAQTLGRGVVSLYGRVPTGDWFNCSHMRHESLGEGGVGSTIDDMLIWARALREGDPRIAPALWAQVKSPAVLADGQTSNYGLGLALTRWRGVDFIGHGGLIFGASSTVLSSPDHGVDIVLLANANLPTEAIAKDLMVLVIGEDAFSASPTPARSDRHAALIDSLFVAPDIVVGFVDLDGVLGATIQGSPGIPLEETGESGRAFAISGGQSPISLELTDDTEGATLLCTMGGQTHVARRDRGQPPMASAVADELAGDYLSEDLGNRIALRLDGDRLRIESAGRYGVATFEATPVATDILRVTGGYAPFLLSPRRTAGTVDRLDFNTVRTRNLTFTRVG
jgi:CubicO group peptidase (beta-lactamase class C family)